MGLNRKQEVISRYNVINLLYNRKDSMGQNATDLSKASPKSLKVDMVKKQRWYIKMSLKKSEATSAKALKLL